MGCVMLTPSRSLRFSGEFMAGRLAVQRLHCSLLKQMCMELVRSVPATFHRAAYFTVGAVLWLCGAASGAGHSCAGGQGAGLVSEEVFGGPPGQTTGHGTAVPPREDPLTSVSGQCLEGRMS